MINLLRQVYFFRDVAQLASAPRSGRGGRPFESDHPDIFKGLFKAPFLILLHIGGQAATDSKKPFRKR